MRVAFKIFNNWYGPESVNQNGGQTKAWSTSLEPSAIESINLSCWVTGLGSPRNRLGQPGCGTAAKGAQGRNYFLNTKCSVFNSADYFIITTSISDIILHSISIMKISNILNSKKKINCATQQNSKYPSLPARCQATCPTTLHITHIA